MQTKSVIECVTRFVTQDAHAFNVSAAFDFSHEFALELEQPRVRQIKRNRKARHPVRREPFSGQPHMRLETNAPIVEFTVETFDVRFDEGTFDTYGKIADTSVE